MPFPWFWCGSRLPVVGRGRRCRGHFVRRGWGQLTSVTSVGRHFGFRVSLRVTGKGKKGKGKVRLLRVNLVVWGGRRQVHWQCFSRCRLRAVQHTSCKFWKSREIIPVSGAHGGVCLKSEISDHAEKLRASVADKNFLSGAQPNWQRDSLVVFRRFEQIRDPLMMQSNEPWASPWNSLESLTDAGLRFSLPEDLQSGLLKSESRCTPEAGHARIPGSLPQDVTE